jgi:ABC-type antimicrobial peptide transport system permease subunit
MSTLTILLIVWGVLTGVLILLLIYRSTLSMHEDEQLFIDESSKNLREEQEALQIRMNKVTPWVRILGAVSGVLIIVIAGMAVWQRMNAGY